jgi:hypothetical protein
MHNELIKPVNPSELPKFIRKFANGMLRFGCFYSIIIVLFSVFKIYYPLDPVNNKFYIIFIILGGISSILFGLGLKLKDELKVNLSIVYLVIIVTVYGFELYLSLQRGIQSPSEIIIEHRKAGIEVYPNIHPGHLINSNGLYSNKGQIFPLGGISNIHAITGIDIIKTDEYGFNNAKGLYNQETIDIILTGGSFSQGFDVKIEKNICAILRKLKFNAISIGMNGNGPLREYAALREYAKPLKPNIVLWSNTYGDLKDIRNAFRSSFLKKYLFDDEFDQRLITRQSEIDSVIKNYLNQKLEEIKDKEKLFDQKRIEYHWFLKIIKLYNTRNRFNIVPKSKPKVYQKFEEERIIYKTIIEKSKKMISKWNGKLYIIYLPLFNYSTGNDSSPMFNLDYEYRKFVLSIANELDLPIIDIFSEVFDSHSDPSSLFPYRMEGHYNALGYRLVANAINQRLQADGIFPSNLNY